MWIRCRCAGWLCASWAATGWLRRRALVRGTFFNGTWWPRLFLRSAGSCLFHGLGPGVWRVRISFPEAASQTRTSSRLGAVAILVPPPGALLDAARPRTT